MSTAHKKPTRSGSLRIACLLACAALAASCAGSGAPAGSVDSNGGTITSPDGRVSVTIPPGALSGPKIITVTPSQAEGAIPGATYAFAPDGLTFSKPVTIAIKYETASVPAGVNEADLRRASTP